MCVRRKVLLDENKVSNFPCILNKVQWLLDKLSQRSKLCDIMKLMGICMSF